MVRMVAAGRTPEDIREDFPFIEPEDVQQALLYAAHATESAGLSLPEPA